MMLLPTLFGLTLCVGLSVSDYPTPDNIKYAPLLESATLNDIKYDLTWDLERRDELANVSIAVYSGNGTDRSLVFWKSTGGYAAKITVPLNYYTIYSVDCSAIYHLADNSIVTQNGTIAFTTISGYSNPVRSLTPKQDGTSDKVILTWEPPRVTNGRPKRYDIIVNLDKGGQYQPTQEAKPEDKKATVTIKNAKKGSKYEIVVVPVNHGNPYGPVDISGQSAFCSITLKDGSAGGLSGWVIALIVILVLAVVGGVGFYFMKMRR